MSGNNPTASAQPAPVNLVRDRMSVTNLEVLGNLVKSWSTGDGSHNADGVFYPEPATPQELVQLLTKLGAGVVIPEHITKLTIVHYGANEMVLRVPPAALIKAKEERLKTESYTVPEFYADDPVKGTEPGATHRDKLALQAKRIGDYTIAHCE